MRLFNRIDVKDTVDKWMEAHVIELNRRYIRIHYKGWSSKFDEYLPAEEEEFESLIDVKVAEIGRFSKAFGQAKF